MRVRLQRRLTEPPVARVGLGLRAIVRVKKHRRQRPSRTSAPCRTSRSRHDVVWVAPCLAEAFAGRQLELVGVILLVEPLPERTPLHAPSLLQPKRHAPLPLGHVVNTQYVSAEGAAPCVAAGIPEQWPLSIQPEQFALTDADAAPADLEAACVNRPYEVLDIERGTPLAALLADLAAFLKPQLRASAPGSILRLVRQTTGADGRISHVELDPSSTAEEADLFNLGGGALDPSSGDKSPPRLIVTTLPIQGSDPSPSLQDRLQRALQRVNQGAGNTRPVLAPDHNAMLAIRPVFVASRSFHSRPTKSYVIILPDLARIRPTLAIC